MKNINPPITLIFLGLQGSGKGTQALELKNKYNFSYIDTGALFRNMLKNKKGYYIEAIKIIEKGKLVPSYITNQIMEKEISKISSKKSLIIDGYPRTLSQAYKLSKILKKTGRDKNYLLIFFKINKKNALKRLLNRWICSKCGIIYSSFKKKCKCGGKLEKRSDEKPELIKNRFKFVSRNLDKIKKYYQKINKVLEINAERPIKAITYDLVKKIGL